MRTRNQPRISRLGHSWRAAAGAACALAAVGLSACGGGNPPAGKPQQTVTVFTTLSGVIPGTSKLPWQEWAAAFGKADPSVHLDVITGASSSAAQAMYARIVAAERAGQAPPVDVLDASAYIPQLAAAGALVRLSPSAVPNMSKVAPAELAAVKDLAVPYRGSSVVLAYNAARVPRPPRTLAGLLAWIRAHPGKFAYNVPAGGGSGQAFAEAVVQQHIPPAVRGRLVTGFDQSLEKYWSPGLTQLHDLTRYLYRGSDYPKTNDDTLSDLADGAIWMGPVWSDGASAARADGELPPGIRLSQISPPFYGGPSDLAIIKGTRNLAAAGKLISFMLSPGAQQMMVTGMNGYPGVELKYEPAPVRQKFASIDTAWSQNWSSNFDLDFNSLWQQRVPG